MPEVTRYVLSVMCEDKVGVVSHLAHSVEKLQGNIETLHQSVLQGYFVINFIASFTGSPTAEEIASFIQTSGTDNDFIVGVLPRREAPLPPATSGAGFVLTIVGNDAPGIFGKITACLADRQINIEDLTSQAHDDKFIITARLTIPEELSIPAVRMDLVEILSPCDATVTLMHEDIFNATSRVGMK
ncbi:MAG: hypothetical protein JXA52_08505 [Planctomycetes bacterium]|nr:hypothetical protein [Planctomycetota bacterium]